jgi:hypothetical protein
MILTRVTDSAAQHPLFDFTKWKNRTALCAKRRTLNDRWIKWQLMRKSCRRKRDGKVSSADHGTMPIVTVCAVHVLQSEDDRDNSKWAKEGGITSSKNTDDAVVEQQILEGGGEVYEEEVEDDEEEIEPSPASHHGFNNQHELVYLTERDERNRIISMLARIV